MDSIKNKLKKNNQKLFKQKILKIGARKSLLSRLQAYELGSELKRLYPKIKLQFTFTSSFGDRNLDLDFKKIEDKGVFTEDLRVGLKEGCFDVLVHSWKDLPTDRDKGESRIFTPLRADQRDLLLVKKKNLKKAKEMKKLKVFTSSPRRAFQVKEFIKAGLFSFEVEKTQAVPIRGNVPTRLNKLMDSQEVDALIVAKAALDRLLFPLIHQNEGGSWNQGKSLKGANQIEDAFKAFLKGLSNEDQKELIYVQKKIRHCLKNCLWTVFPLRLFPTSPAQGALAIEILKERKDLERLFIPLHKAHVFESVSKERGLLSALGGGCYQNIGVSSLRRSYGQITYSRGDFALNSSNQKSNPLLKTLFKSPLRSNLKSKKPYEILESLNDLKSQWGHQRTVNPPKRNMQIENFQWKKILKKNIFPFHLHQAKFFKRELIKVMEDLKDLSSFFWVSKAEALPKAWDGELKKNKHVLWAAGVSTWRKLALRGLWVNGCSESLGEKEKEGIERLLGKETISWIKFTHLDSTHFKGKRKCATYKLLPLLKTPNLKDKTHFYWQSESQFLFALKKYKNLRKAFHASGPGHTFEAIKNEIPQGRRKIFLSHKAWKEFVLS